MQRSQKFLAPRWVTKLFHVPIAILFLASCTESKKLEQSYTVTFDSYAQLIPSFPISWAELNRDLEPNPTFQGLPVGEHGVVILALSRKDRKDYFIYTKNGGHNWLYADNAFGCSVRNQIPCTLVKMYKLPDNRVVVEYNIHTLILSQDMKTVVLLRHPFVNSPSRASLRSRLAGGYWLLASDHNSSDPAVYWSFDRGLYYKSADDTSWLDTNIRGTELNVAHDGKFSIFSFSPEAQSPEIVTMYSERYVKQFSINLFTNTYQDRINPNIYTDITPSGEFIIFDDIHGFKSLSLDGSLKCSSTDPKHGTQAIYLDTIFGVTMNTPNQNVPKSSIIVSHDLGCSWKTIATGVTADGNFLSSVYSIGDKIILTTFNVINQTFRTFRLENDLEIAEIDTPIWARKN